MTDLKLQPLKIDKEMTMEYLVLNLIKEGLLKSDNLIYVEDGYKLCTVEADKLDSLNIENMANPYVKDNMYTYTNKEGSKLCFFTPLGVLSFPLLLPSSIIMSKSV